MNVKGKVAVITGGAIRVGKAITLALAQAGCHVFIHYGQSAEPAQQTQAEAERYGVRAKIYSADLSDISATQSIIPQAQAVFGKVDVLVNNAAIFLDGGLAETTLDMWESQIAINLRAPFLLSQAFAEQVGEWGKIVNITDARVFRPGADHFAYRLTKSALVTLTETLAHDLAPHITVNAVALGAILPAPGKTQADLDQIAEERVPLKYAGSAKSVAHNVLHLLQQDFITGTTIRLDGGEFL